MNNGQHSLKGLAEKPPCRTLRIVILGCLHGPRHHVTSAGNTLGLGGAGHATVYRPLVKGLVRRGHDVLFLQRGAGAPSDANKPQCRIDSYRTPEELEDRFLGSIASADAVMMGSGLEDGLAIAEWVMANLGRHGVAVFYDIDAPATMSQLTEGNCKYMSAELIPRLGAYFCCSAGPLLKRIASRFNARQVLPLCCAVDEEQYFFQPAPAKYDLGYIAPYNPDRQDTLDKLMFQVARHWPHGRFLIAGVDYPQSMRRPDNIKLAGDLSGAQRLESYNGQRFFLNVSRCEDPLRQGVAPQANLLEAAACATPIISDWWHGVGQFFEPGEEILIAVDSQQVLYYLRRLSPQYAAQIGRRARQRVLTNHTAGIRAAQLENHLMEMLIERAPASVRLGRGKDAGQSSFETAA